MKLQPYKRRSPGFKGSYKGRSPHGALRFGKGVRAGIAVISIGLLLGGGALWLKHELTEHFDTLIVRGLIVDGTGEPARRGALGVKDGRIAEVKWPWFAEADRIIDAQGLVVCPGFIDVHTHIEGNVGAGRKNGPLLANNFLAQGITTIITGNCGTSAPSLAQFFGQLQKRGVEINIGSLVGHNTIRRQAMGEATREPTSTELIKMRELVERAMKDGALGFSTGLEYNPGAFAEPKEIEALASVVVRYDGVYATHMREEGNKVLASIREALSVARDTHIQLEISHLKSRGRVNWGRSRELISLIDQARASGIQVNCDIYPYTASSTSLEVLIPKRDREGGTGKLRERLRDPNEHKRVVADVVDQVRSEGWRDFSFARVASCQFAPEYNGLTIPEITRLRNQPARTSRVENSATRDEHARRDSRYVQSPAVKPSSIRAIRRKDGSVEPDGIESSNRQIDLVSQSETVCYVESRGGAQMIYENMSEADVMEIARLPYSMLGSDSGIRTGEGRPHPRGCGAAPRFLFCLAVEHGLISMEEAVRKMTSLAADTFHIPGRGRLLPGYAADIVLFDPHTIKDTASYDEPFLPPDGIAYVLVNGSTALDHGQIGSMNSGQVIINESQEKDFR